MKRPGLIPRSKAPKAIDQPPEVKVYRLYSTALNKEEEFRLYDDKDVGLDEQWISDLQIEARMDDDVDTDEEIYNNAQNAIRNDFKEA